MNIVCLHVEKSVHRAWPRKPIAREALDLYAVREMLMKESER